MMAEEEVAKAPATKGTSRTRGGKPVPSIHPDAETHAALRRIKYALSTPAQDATLAQAVSAAVGFYRKAHKGKHTGLLGGPAADTVFVEPEDYDYLLLTLAPAILKTERRPSSLIEAMRVVVRFYVDQHPDLPE